MKNWLFLLAALLLIIAIAEADVAVTVYNENLGLVRDIREVEFPKGVGEVRFTDVAARILPTSVHFKSDMAALLEQNYEYDLVDAAKLLSKYIDHEVKLTDEDANVYLGMLLASSGDIVLRERDGKIRSLSRDRIVNVEFPELPEGLITRPTLVWLVDGKKAGKGKAEISYLTEGMSWHAEYVAVTDKKDESLDLTGWVSIDNRSGTTYKNARLKLMAGDVQIVRDKGRGRAKRIFGATAESAAPQFEEQPFYEYHLYTLQRPSTLKDNQVKQISLFPTAAVKSVEKEYRMEWTGEKGKAKVTLVFKNEKQNGLGIPLPKGKIRVYKEGPDGGQEFVGEDRIDHTPSNEEVRVSTGKAFDIVGERRETDRKRNERAVEIKIRNRKDETVEIIVPEYLHGDWTILEATEGWEKKSATVIEWKVKVKSDEEKVITYRVLWNR